MQVSKKPSKWCWHGCSSCTYGGANSYKCWDRLLLLWTLSFLSVYMSSYYGSSFICPFLASQVTEVSPGVCAYPRSPAYALGITAALALLVAQIVINFASGCVCCRRNPYASTTHWTLALVCFVISWFTFVMALLLLLGGAALNDEHGAENVYFSYYYCYVVKPGVFAVAAMLSLASVVLGILYYFTISSGKTVNYPLSNHPNPPNQSGIAMGHPQVPPTSHDPVFVHEDTYIRRQFT